MKSVVFALFVAIAVAGCKRDKNESAETAATRPAPKVAPKPTPRTILPEPEALHILLTLDSSRIASARAVSELSQSDAVLEFARIDVADHRAVWRMLFALSQQTGTTPTDNVTSQNVRVGSEQFVTELMARDSGINNSYLAHEVREHEQMLMLLDTALIPSARDTALQTLLQQIRPMVEAHVQQARRIQTMRAEAARRAAAGIVGPVTAPGVSPSAARGAARPDSLKAAARPARPDSSRLKPARQDTAIRLLGTPITTTNM